MEKFIVLDRDWRVVQQKELSTFEEAKALVEVCAKNQRNGPYRITKVVAYGKLIPEAVVIDTDNDEPKPDLFSSGTRVRVPKNGGGQ